MAEAAVSEPAPAKLNLFLRVLGRRDDGYHDVETLILPLTLADGVRASRRDHGLSLAVAAAPDVTLPPAQDNLVLRAARALAEATGHAGGADLVLAKRIPVAAGLGGGSADAAAAFRALDRLWGLGLGPAGLVEVAATVGSDVAALLWGRPVLARGRGDRVEPVEALPRTWWVLLPQEFGVSSADAYAWWDGDGGHTGPDPTLVLQATTAGDVEAIANVLFNDLERPVARRREPVVGATRALLEAGALGAIMCGSGPTVAGLCRDGSHAEEVAAASRGTVVASITRPPT